jgi:predicted transcriptional regulator
MENPTTKSFRLGGSLAEKLEKLAAYEDTSESDILRSALRHYIHETGPDEDPEILEEQARAREEEAAHLRKKARASESVLEMQETEEEKRERVRAVIQQRKETVQTRLNADWSQVYENHPACDEVDRETFEQLLREEGVHE